MSYDDGGYAAAQEMWDAAVPDEPYEAEVEHDDRAPEAVHGPAPFAADEVIELEVIDRFDRVIDHLTIKARP